jgi:hypothetical protein
MISISLLIDTPIVVRHVIFGLVNTGLRDGAIPPSYLAVFGESP